jgi:predicted permease
MSMLRDLGPDLRYGARTLGRSPGFTLVVGFTLALGLGANTAIFNVFNALLLRPLPVREPEQLMFLSDALGSGRSTSFLAGPDGRIRAFSYPMYQRLRGDRNFQALAAEDSQPASALVSRSGADDPEAAATGVAVTANYFSTLGVDAARGRTFLPADETAPGSNPVMVLSHGYWQRRFGGDAAVVGQNLSVDGKPYTVVGVTVPRFAGSKAGESVDFWVPITMHAQLQREDPLFSSRTSWLLVVGRLRRQASTPATEAGLTATLRQHLQDIQSELSASEREVMAKTGVHIRLEPGARGVSRLRRDFRDAVLVLMGGVSLLLLIVCLNVSHLLLARAVQRKREMCIRTALGASRARLARQLLAEGALLAGAGVAGGALATPWLTDGLLALAVPGAARALAVGADGRVWLFSALLALATAILLGVVPAWYASRTDLQDALRGTSPSVASGGSRRLVSRFLLTSQIAFSLVLLVGAGLLTGTLSRLRDVDKGFDEERVLLADLDLRFVGLGEPQLPAFYQDLLRRVTELPGVQTASLALFQILDSGRYSSIISFAGAPGPLSSKSNVFPVTRDYFDTVGISLARGRGLSAADRSGSPRVAVVNETLARGAFGRGQVIGQRFRFGDPLSGEPADVEVVGVVRDAKINGLKQPPGPVVYVPVAQHLGAGVNALQVRVLGDPARLVERVRQAIRESHGQLRVSNVRTMSAAVERSLRQERLLVTLSSAFGLAALFLVSVGLYGLISQWAIQRNREIGLRMALGSTTAGVRWLVLRQALGMVVTGVAVGLPAAMAGAQVLVESLLFGITPLHPPTLALAGLLMFAVAVLAAYLPAHRASRLDPMLVLRVE